ncbi:unnamed protein product [Euphydryas editha]|uniref:PHD-type domain-containing protein n=1 Tax=Euphydryas editha TaxID=104508 RepID=A0AAU9TYW2_EUPED|nr:unnamed protein product [Euphydryas editha]
MDCAACRCVIIENEEFLRCTFENCHKMYHLLCAGGKKLTESISTWVCPECLCATKKGGDNCLTPVGISKSHEVKTSHFERKKYLQLVSEILNTKKLWTICHLRALREEMAGLKDQLENACMHRSAATITPPLAKNAPQLLNQDKMTYTPSEPITKITKTKPKHKLTGDDALDINMTPTDAIEAKRQTANLTEAVHCHVEHAPTLSTALSGPIVEQISTVVRRRNSRPPSLSGTAGPDVTTLKAVEARKHIHLWNMKSGLEEIREYIRQLCPNGTFTVEELSSRGSYKSYKIGVPVAYYDHCMSANVWPVSARLKAWIIYKKPAKPHSIDNASQSFRRTMHQ